MEIYVTLALLWTLYMGIERFAIRPQSRPYFVGFIITNLVLFPLAFVLSLTSGILRERIETIISDVRKKKKSFSKTGRKKLIG